MLRSLNPNASQKKGGFPTSAILQLWLWFLPSKQGTTWDPDTAFHSLLVDPYQELGVGTGPQAGKMSLAESILCCWQENSSAEDLPDAERPAACQPVLGACTEHYTIRTSQPRLGHSSEVVLHYHWWGLFVFPCQPESMLLLPNPPCLASSELLLYLC